MLARMFKRNPAPKKSDTVVSKEIDKKDLAHDAIARWDKILASNPDDHENQVLVGNAYIEMGALDKAWSLIDSLKPDTTTVDSIDHLRLKYHIACEEHDLAKIVLTELLARNPEDIDSLVHLGGLEIRAENYEVAKEILQTVEKLATREDIRCLLLSGRLSHAEENWTEAEQSWKSTLELKPNHYEASLMLSVSLSRQAKFKECLSVAEAALEFHPKRIPILAQKRRALVKLEKHAEALEVVNEEISLEPKNPRILMDKLNLLIELGDIEQAENLCSVAMSESPDDIQLLTIYARLGQKKLKLA